VPLSPRRVASAVLLVAAVAAISGCAADRGPFPAGQTAGPSESPSSIPVPEQISPSSETSEPSNPSGTGFDKGAKSIDDAASLWVVVNKTRQLDPKEYAASDLVSVPVPYANPPMLRTEASDAVVAMFADFAEETGLEMQSQSAYRSYSAQVRVYDGWVASKGKEAADLTSARPGFSEHQTGLAIDISAKPAKCTLNQCFADTPQGEWLAANAWKYGFILRYPEGLTEITGYEFEPWHYRYVGTELARDYHDTGATTLEQYFDLPAAPDYLG
jgi:D-alanyl-D-alanine carboxypeptidase